LTCPVNTKDFLSLYYYYYNNTSTTILLHCTFQHRQYQCKTWRKKSFLSKII